MSKQVLRSAYLLLNSVNLSDHVQQLTVTWAKTDVEITAMGDGGKKHLAGLEDNKFTVTFWQDHAASSVGPTLDAIFAGGTAVAFKIADGGTAFSPTNPTYAGRRSRSHRHRSLVRSVTVSRTQSSSPSAERSRRAHPDVDGPSSFRSVGNDLGAAEKSAVPSVVVRPSAVRSVRSMTEKPMERRFMGTVEFGPPRAAGLDRYAAVFNEPTDIGPFMEQIDSRAFDQTLRSLQTAGTRSDRDVIAVKNHEPNELLGRTSNGTLRLSTDTRGLKYEIDVNEKDPAAVSTSSRCDAVTSMAVRSSFRPLTTRGTTAARRRCGHSRRSS